MKLADCHQPTLVILAAGASRRYGGLKQLTPVGPDGSTLIDYATFDALRAGFGRLVLVIRPETESEFRARFAPSIEPHMKVSYCPQSLDASRVPGEPHGRPVPWGTGHAVLAAACEVNGPFAVANADDYYGASSFRAVRDFLSRGTTTDIPNYAVVGYPLSETLSDSGGVSRAVCDCGSDDDLCDLVETVGIERDGRNARYKGADGLWHGLKGTTLVSMNLWAFHPTVFDPLRRRFERHQRQEAEADGSEFRLPTAIRDLLREGVVRIRVLRSDSVWFGLTHPQDTAPVIDRIRSLVAAGYYPAELWG